jgi:hypothetical protein
MQIILKIKSKNAYDKLHSCLKQFDINEIEIIYEEHTISKNKIEITDDYIEKNWREIVSDALSSFDEDCYKSEQYKLDRGEFLIGKYK